MESQERLSLEYQKFKFEQRLAALHLAKDECAQKVKNTDEVIELAKKYLVYLENEK